MPWSASLKNPYMSHVPRRRRTAIRFCPASWDTAGDTADGAASEALLSRGRAPSAGPCFDFFLFDVEAMGFVLVELEQHLAGAVGDDHALEHVRRGVLGVRVLDDGRDAGF